MVYVIDINGNALMPTTRHGKVRRLLKNGLAVVVSHNPFTIKLKYQPKTNQTQQVTLGVDIGSKHVGLSASTEKKELYAEVLKLRNDIKSLLEERRGHRRLRRNRLRYRPARWSNRRKSKQPGWIAPTLRNKIHFHVKPISKIVKFLPIAKIVVEQAKFDTAKLANPEISHFDYQHGLLYGYYNMREYVLYRDGHKCQICKGKSKDNKLETHHIVYRSEGGNDSADNLVTLCHTCHRALHDGKIELKLKGSKKKHFDAAHMNIIRNRIISDIITNFPDIEVELVYGYETKCRRNFYGIEKTHVNDALCISGNCKAKMLDDVYFSVQKRKHNRKLFKDKILSRGKRKRQQAPYFVKGFCLWDKVKHQNKELFIQSRRSTGWFELKESLLSKGTIRIKSSELKLLERNKTIIINILGRSSIPVQH